MVKVRALVRCYIDNILREAGDVFPYDGEVTEGGPIEPLEGEPVRRGGRKKQEPQESVGPTE